MKTSFDWSKYWANTFVTLSCPISLAFNLKWYFVLVILIYIKIRLFLAAVCPSGPQVLARIVHYFRLPRFAAATKFVDVLCLLFQDGCQQNAEITKPKS